jgi:HEAT repeat protein
VSLATRTRATYAVWQALCGVFQDSDEDEDVRVAAARALGRHNPAAAPNQLCRPLAGDPARRVRREAVAVLSQVGRVPATLESGLQRDLDTLRAHIAPLPLANLALTYGRDPRVLAALNQALGHTDPAIRVIAQRGLGMLGEMSAVVRALHDEASQVRAGAAETLGFYSLLAEGDIAALEAALQDGDADVRQAAQVALRRLGRRPLPVPPPVARTQASSSEATAPDAWRPFLEQWSRQWLGVHEYAVEQTDEVIASGWLGYPGATEQEVEQLERRLGRTLPPSYRAFLRVSNGWRRTSPFIEQVWSTADVGYFRERHQDWIDVLMDDASEVSDEQHGRYGDEQDVIVFRAEYLRDAVQISDVGDAAVYLLNPVVVTADGEWEAWFLASWLPGAKRYRSFWDLLHAEYAAFTQLESQTS